jgi:dolichol-phosphate mannosyltransferase
MASPELPDRVWVVLPTFNEVENLAPVVRRTLAAMAEVCRTPRVLVVDDASPDGTGRLADRLADEDRRVEVLHNGAKHGLGRAYVAGFGRTLAAGADLVLEMDADLSHDPADLPRLIRAALTADLAIGSRYAEGGSVRDWSTLRRAVSRVGCWYARKVLGLQVRDLTSGFRCFRAEVLRTIDLDDVRANGYVFQVELSYRASLAGFRIVEVPITFSDREHGASKMTAGVALEAVWKVPALRLGRRIRRFLR